jgi:UDP-galactose transporter B1
MINADFSSDLTEAIAFSLRFPESIYDILLFGLFGSIGQLFIFYTLERFGSLILVTVNVTRKMFSMLLSIFWFNHSMSTGQWLAVLTVFGGIGLDALISARINQKTPKSLKNE